METHAHELHKAPGHGWKHYFFEFFMLFLAVFSGFLAENLREHLVEKQREKQYIRSLVNDLRLDIIWLDSVSKSAAGQIQNLDSGILFLAKSNEIPLAAYLHLRSATTPLMFFPNDGTLAQLKNSGGMRLITSRATVDSIEQYDRQMRRIEVRRNITNAMVRDFTESLNKTVSGNDLLTALYDSTFYKKTRDESRSIKLVPQYQNELINQSISLRLRAMSDTAVNTFIKKNAFSLIKFLTTKYSLNNRVVNIE